MGPVIEAAGLTHEYPDGTTAVADVDLTVRAGERVAVIGANGSGKSTLQLVLGGLVEPTGGTVRYFGETTDAEAVRERLGVLLQDPDDYLFNTTVRGDLEYGPAQLGVPRERAAERVESLAADLGLTDLLDRPPFRLSGGEKQRAAVASVLSFSPEVLLLDEPLGAVDARYRERILDLVDGHAGTTVVFTPSLDAVPELAERVVLVAPDGSVAADGGVREVLTDRRLLEANGLRPPAMVRLFEGVDGVDEVPLTVAEARPYIADGVGPRGDADRGPG
ncbi:MAG: energy-coupling factor ABC transporter ATP-binding protein [Haloarculaceae archaeon]